MNKIYITNEQSALPVDAALRGLIRRAVGAALRYEGYERPVEVSVTLTDNEGIRELNREYRDKDSATDVLSFPMFDDAGDERDVLGDIVISLERAAAQAQEYGHTLTREVAFLTVHSVLHLLGYDHETGPEDEAEMFAKQKEILERMEITR